MATRPVPPDDKGMMTQPEFWPRWPVLPLKRWDSDKRETEHGFILADGEFTVYMASIFGLTGGTVREVLAKIPQDQRRVYVNADDLLRAGWRVD